MTPGDVLIRPAQPADAGAARRLLATLGHAPDALDHVDARLGEGRDHTLVAELAGEVVGLANAVAALPLEYARPQLRIFSLVVDPAHRRRGVARALVRELEALAVRLGCFRVELPMQARSARHVRNGERREGPLVACAVLAPPIDGPSRAHLGRSLVDGHAFWRAAGYDETGGRWVRRL